MELGKAKLEGKQKATSKTSNKGEVATQGFLEVAKPFLESLRMYFPF